MILVNRFNFFFLFTVYLIVDVAICAQKRYRVCSSEIQTSECNRGYYLSFKCTNGLINITGVFARQQWPPRSCDDSAANCEECCQQLNRTMFFNETVTKSVSDRCNNNITCSIRPNNINRSYTVYYHCIPTNPPTQSLTSTTTAPTIKIRTEETTITNPALTPETSTSTILHITTTTETKTEVTSTSTRQTTTPFLTTRKSKSITTSKNTQKTYNPGNSSKQTEPAKFPTVAVAAPVTIVVILACVILAVVCIVRRRRQKNDEIYGANDQNNSDILQSVSNPAYTSDCLDNKSHKRIISEQRTPSFSQDSGYAECQDVDTVDADDGEYNTTNFEHTTPKVDPTYNHISKQAQMVDNTYSHFASEQTKIQASSNYSNLNVKPRQSKIDVNDSTYNTLQTLAINKSPKSLPCNDEVSENEYNHANFTTGMSKPTDDNCEYSHLNSQNNGIPGAVAPQSKLSKNDVEYAKVMTNNNEQEPNEESAHTYFVLEKGNVNTEKGQYEEEESGRNNTHACFVLDEDCANDKTTGGNISDSTPHEYFVLRKQ